MLSYPDAALHEVMGGAASRFAGRTAFWFEGKALTLVALDSESNRLGNALRALGLGSGDRLAIFLANCPEYVIAIYAASKLGAISTPLSAAYRESEITHVLNDSGATVLLTQAKLWPFVEPLLERLPSLREVVLLAEELPSARVNVHLFADVMSRNSAAAPQITVDPGATAVLPYSSGTTGKPKGVMLSHRNLISCHAQLAEAGRIGPDDVFLLYTPLAHIYGLSAIMGVGIYAGAQQILLERFDLDTVVRLTEEWGVTWLHVVPPVLLALANTPGLRPEQFRSVKFILNAAAPIAPEVAHRVEDRLHVRVIQAYGMTEASPATHHSPLEPGCIRLESVGVPLALTEQRIVDLETGRRTLAPGEVGELVVRGPQIMQGYWNAPRETAGVLRGGWLHTGDIGWIDEQGYAFISDRKKEMIKCNAFSIAPAELEAVLLDHPDVADCGVVGVPDEESGQVPKAFVVLREGATSDVDTLNQFVAQRVAGYKRIRQWAIVRAIPRTPSGKILRRELKS